jgi:hypothetical protein
VRPHFFLSFYFWLDTVAVLSLAFELPALRAVLLLGATQVGQAGSCCSTWQHPNRLSRREPGRGCVCASCSTRMRYLQRLASFNSKANQPSEMLISLLLQMHASC